MKTGPILALAIILTAPVQAFDPAAGPPPDKTIEWTTGYLTGIRRQSIAFADSPLGDCLKFLELELGPVAYRIEIDAKALGDAKLDTPITLNGKDMNLISILSKLADAVDASLVIERGKVSFIPKKK
jgi:hypothetical protein